MSGTPREPELYERNPTGRFTDRAADYRRFRPSYPAAAIDAILEGLGEPARLLAADIGAGTGISARLLAERGCRVLAVEPNAAMRAGADPHPRVEFRDGQAERTGLPDRSVDLVLAAQSFHWFKPGEALREFHRILRPGGRLAIMWNQRDDSDPFTSAYTDLITRAADHTPEERWSLREDVVRDHGLFEPPRELAFANAQALDLDGLIGRAASASYVPRSGPRQEELVRGLRAAFERFRGRDGRVRLVYRTVLYLSRPIPA